MFDGDYLVAWVLAPLAVVAVALFLRFTDVGVAVRAAADRADRASLLGIPVGRLHTCVWAIAAVLSFLALFLQAGIVGLPLGSPVGLTVLLSALAALMLGRLTDLPAIVASAMALGLLEAHVRWNDELVVGPLHLDLGSDSVVAPVLAVVILVTLLVRRRGVTRADSDATSSWQAAGEVRPDPAPSCAAARGAARPRRRAWPPPASALVALPAVLGPGQTLRAAAVVAFALVILSITMLTGWAGPGVARADGLRRHRRRALGAHATHELGLGPGARPAGGRPGRARPSPSSSACPPCGCGACTWR